MNVEDLYKNKFSDFQVTPSDQDWNELQRRLKKKSFLQFNLARFNIYYIVLFFSISAFASYSTVRNFVLQKQVCTMEKTIHHYKRTIDSLIEKPNLVPLVLKDTLSLQIKPSLLKVNNLPKNIPTLTFSGTTIDTVVNSTPDTSVRKQRVSIHKIRKTIYVKQQVVRKDTLIVLH